MPIRSRPTDLAVVLVRAGYIRDQSRGWRVGPHKSFEDREESLDKMECIELSRSSGHVVESGGQLASIAILGSVGLVAKSWNRCEDAHVELSYAAYLHC